MTDNLMMEKAVKITVLKDSISITHTGFFFLVLMIIGFTSHSNSQIHFSMTPDNVFVIF